MLKKQKTSKHLDGTVSHLRREFCGLARDSDVFFPACSRVAQGACKGIKVKAEGRTVGRVGIHTFFTSNRMEIPSTNLTISALICLCRASIIQVHVNELLPWKRIECIRTSPFIEICPLPCSPRGTRMEQECDFFHRHHLMEYDTMVTVIPKQEMV